MLPAFTLYTLDLQKYSHTYTNSYLLHCIYCSLGKIWCEKIFVGCQVRRKLNTRKVSYHKEIEQFIMVFSLLRRIFYHGFLSHEYFQPLIFPKLRYSQLTHLSYKSASISMWKICYQKIIAHILNQEQVLVPWQVKHYLLKSSISAIWCYHIKTILFHSRIFAWYCLRPPIVDFLFPVTRPHCNFSAACIFIIAFGDHVIKIFVAAMLLSVCVVVSLGQQLVLWCIIETQDTDISEFSDTVFTAIKPGKFESVSTSSDYKQQI